MSRIEFHKEESRYLTKVYSQYRHLELSNKDKAILFHDLSNLLFIRVDYDYNYYAEDPWDEESYVKCKFLARVDGEERELEGVGFTHGRVAIFALDNERLPISVIAMDDKYEYMPTYLTTIKNKFVYLFEDTASPKYFEGSTLSLEDGARTLAKIIDMIYDYFEVSGTCWEETSSEGARLPLWKHYDEYTWETPNE